jgi:hypothetical protein
MSEVAHITNKTHYRKAFKSPYLSSEEVVTPVVLTIKEVRYEDNKAGRKEQHCVAYFAETEIRPGERLKPMILNVGNCKIIRAFADDSPFIEDWAGIKIRVYADKSVKFGKDVVGGLRIDPSPPKTERLKVEPGTELWERAKTAFERDKNLDAVKLHADITPEHEAQLIKEVMDV